ncbi:MAG: AAA family ATPase [Ectothiorhodospiraceae bacterium]|nr:AAA family ATPase [Chromatiales bacterium]MCP5155032.1 AAA family ATPase [Ectothiorhodospiraceae bacterium]
MYLEHFGLAGAPFALTPDTEYFLNRSGYQDALNVLLVALRSGEGFVQVVGEVGTGKTLLCRKLMSSLGDDFAAAYVHNPFLDPIGLLHAVADELGVELSPDAGQHETIKRLGAALIASHAAGRAVVLCLDEAQAMPLETLEALRLLTNLETEKRKLLQVVLFGQPELEALLACPSVRQLRQRITFTYRLRPMSRPALETYVAHRLAVAGWSGRPLLDRPALDLLHRVTGGVPRLVNVVCHKALMCAYGRGDMRVGVDAVAMAAADTPAALAASGLGARWRGQLMPILGRIAITAVAGALAAALPAATG